MYLEYSPAPALTRFVECYWRLEADFGIAARRAGESVYPDGRLELIFNLGEPARELRNGRVQRQPESFVYGQLTGRLALEMAARTRVFAIRLHPWGGFPLLGIPLKELTDQAVDLWSLSLPIMARVRTAVEEAGAAEAACREVDRLLTRHVETRNLGLPPVARLVQRIHRGHWGDRVDDLCSRSGWTARTCERHFNRFVGLPPKPFLRVLRFQRMMRTLKADPGCPLVEVALEAGYADQAHLTNDFKQFTGQSPQAFLRSRGGVMEALYQLERLERIF